MSSFRDGQFAQRFAAGGMGDQAERIFELTYPQNWDRFGLDRATINLKRVPEFIRFSPDYVTARGLVEVQGFGNDQRFKLKNAKLQALQDWHAIFQTDIFVWDSCNGRYGWLALDAVSAALDEHGIADSFDNGRNPYRWLFADQLPLNGTWTAYDDTQDVF